ncbi:cAMP-binding protein [Ktedonobacter sp. SOSP1-52]|uniref:Crp/Fnr family transcriptional regulator n=1 Tax=Ktedonobacter sp. SOSP1-52 TaxID=2778366 RepID=UPI001914F05D|nr:Crp/Fnr family transcriptional regulator [Ktedonobacter sp. SOSP1-52]GHO65825.1 cAMP-binding protein [Ktedonobacter sp. SOSP1-52]
MREKQALNQQRPVSHKQTGTKDAFLAHSELFRHLPADDLNALHQRTTETSYPSGYVFYRPGDAGSALFLLKQGAVHLYHLSPDGRKLIMATLQPGACFGETLLLGQGQQRHFAEAVSPTRVYSISRHDIEHLAGQRPGVALALFYSVEQRLHQVETQLINTTFKSTLARLATLLLQLAHAQAREQGQLVVTGLTHEELAEHLGVYRETVSATLRELKDLGTIEPGRRHILITSPHLLATLANPELGTGRSAP